jgi:hypothetical protein
MGWVDAEGDQVPLSSKLRGYGHGFGKSLLVANDVVGGEDEQQRIEVTRLEVERRNGNGRCRVATYGLEDHPRVRVVSGIQLAPDTEAMILVAHDHWCLDARQRRNAVDGCPEHRALIHESQELFWLPSA